MSATQTVPITASITDKETWTAARKALLAKEKDLTRQHDELARLRRELPWTEVTRDYVFEGPQGAESLKDLFAGRSQLIVYHFMFGPEWEEGCPSCSMLADQFDGMLPHLQQRDATFVVISRARADRIKGFQQRMGWRFKWVSSYNTSFNYDYNVSFTKDEVARGSTFYNYGITPFPSDEAPGASVFYKDESGRIFHTYSTYGRGLDALIGSYSWLDFTPKGRDEDALVFPMAWVRHHDKYEATPVAKPVSGACCHSEEHGT
ncbi:MAG: DUF899 domain-containing protein [Bryobacteraceae bacterium]